MPFTKTFQTDPDNCFGATYAAEAWLRENGYSYGPSQRGAPRAIMKGDVSIAKWKNLTGREKSFVDGRLLTGRDQDAVIKLSETPASEQVKL